MNDLLLDLCLAAGLDANYTSGGDEILFECPLCGDHKPRFYINRRTGLWTYFNCGEAGNLLQFLERVLGFDPFEAFHKAQQIKGPTRFEARAHEEAPDEAIELPEGYVKLTMPGDLFQAPYWRYLASRGLHIGNVMAYKMGYALSGPLAYRVIIPIEVEGALKGWVARDITGKAPQKVLTAPGMKTSHVLFNLDLVQGEEVLLVEGVFDALALADKAVATLGTKLSPTQRNLLRRKGFKRVTFLWDADDAGREAVKKYAPELRAAGFEVLVASLPEGKDPAEAGSVAVKKALGAAVPVELEYRYGLRKVLYRRNQEDTEEVA